MQWGFLGINTWRNSRMGNQVTMKELIVTVTNQHNIITELKAKIADLEQQAKGLKLREQAKQIKEQRRG